MKTNQDIIRKLEKRLLEIKKLILQISHEAQVGHIGSSLSIADIITVLYFAILKVNPKKPKWKNRDRFILSKGHAALALYSALYLRDFLSQKQFYSYCKNGGCLGVHPEGNIPGVEISSGSLGHGLSIGIGFALAAQYDKLKYKTFVLLSDAECGEGEVWQAAATAYHHNLNNLIVIVDNNKVQAYGTTKEVLNLEPLSDKWLAFGWKVIIVDGHRLDYLYQVFRKLSDFQDKPTIIIANTVRGKGISFMEHKIEWHYITTSKDQYLKALEELNNQK